MPRSVDNIAACTCTDRHKLIVVWPAVAEIWLPKTRHKRTFVSAVACVHVFGTAHPHTWMQAELCMRTTDSGRGPGHLGINLVICMYTTSMQTYCVCVNKQFDKKVCKACARTIFYVPWHHIIIKFLSSHSFITIKQVSTSPYTTNFESSNKNNCNSNYQRSIEFAS